MKLRHIACAGTAMIAILAASPATAQRQDDDVRKKADTITRTKQQETTDATGQAEREVQGGAPRTEIVAPTGTPGTSANEIVVVGIRGSVASAVNKKRKSKQIVDSVVSEDVGKLPDNNVVDAIARIPGVQITRERGQGQGVSIRGLGGVQTTINGNNANLGTDRSISLADVPAELLKAVDVYKTRTADQVEGSIAGTVNVELRRPLDLKQGLTLAGSARGLYDDIAKKTGPFLSALVAYRAETAIGEVGFLVNGSFTRQNYLETFIQSESPTRVCCGNDETGAVDPNSSRARLPANLRNIIVPFAARSGIDVGYVDRPSLNASLQWAPSSDLSFVVEGIYNGSRERRETNRYYAITGGYGETLTDIVVGPDGRTVNKVTMVNNNPGQIAVGIDNLYSRNRNEFYQINGEMRWTSDRAQLTSSLLHSWSNSGNYNIQNLPRPPALQRTTVDFVGNVGGYTVPTITLQGIDPSNIANLGLERFQDLRGRGNNKEYQAQADLTLKLSEQGFLRTLQTGIRANRRDVANIYGYRDGFPRVVVNGRQVFAPLTDLPGADRARPIGPPIRGAQQWAAIPGEVLFERIADIRAYLQRTIPGQGGAQFASVYPTGELGSQFVSRENNFAMYGQLNYAFKLGFPIDGSIGLRYVNNFGSIQSTATERVRQTVNGVVTETDVRRPAFGRGNFVDLLPSVTAMVHFDEKTQMRLSYTTNVQRVGFGALSPTFFINPSDNPPTVDAGNPDLDAQREHAYDVSLEHYFGRGGIVSLAGFYKKATGFLYYDSEPIADLARYGQPGRSGFLRTNRNGGDGTFIGIEGQAQAFFEFLPGALANFGASVNGTHMFKARQVLPFPEDFPGAYDGNGVSKWTANAALFYETPTFGTRIAYNYRSPYREFAFLPQPDYSLFTDRTERLDVAINFTPVKWATFSLEATNLTGNDVFQYFGKENLLGSGVRLQARTVQGSIRVRY